MTQNFLKSIAVKVNYKLGTYRPSEFDNSGAIIDNFQPRSDLVALIAIKNDPTRGPDLPDPTSVVDLPHGWDSLDFEGGSPDVLGGATPGFGVFGGWVWALDVDRFSLDTEEI